ncbi:MAG: serine hydrolase family protein [Candidatus Aenigmarchaeota archaeon]|nr:serine hydrolase family protein [Candidatus Aenigmarchaeota archaeon]
MAHFILIHGAYGSRNENWFPWIRRELHRLGQHVHTPEFTTPEGQCLDSWMRSFRHCRRYMRPDTVLIGHSLGCAFILSLLEGRKRPVRAAFMIAGFIGKLGISEFDGLNTTFTDKEFDWRSIRKNCLKFRFFASANDPYVPVEKVRQLAKFVKRRPRVIKDAGHFNEECRFMRFDALLTEIKRLLAKAREPKSAVPRSRKPRRRTHP